MPVGQHTYNPTHSDSRQWQCRAKRYSQKPYFLKYPIPEIPDDSEIKLGQDQVRVLPKINMLGIVYPSDIDYIALW